MAAKIEVEKLERAIEDHKYQIKQIRKDLAPAIKRITHIEGLIRDCRKRIEEIERGSHEKTN